MICITFHWCTHQLNCLLHVTVIIHHPVPTIINCCYTHVTLCHYQSIIIVIWLSLPCHTAYDHNQLSASSNNANVDHAYMSTSLHQSLTLTDKSLIYCSCYHQSLVNWIHCCIYHQIMFMLYFVTILSMSLSCNCQTSCYLASPVYFYKYFIVINFECLMPIKIKLYMVQEYVL